jgi:type VI protein secretion system component VasK
MSVMRGIWGLIAICAAIVALALAGLAWDFLTGLEFNIDGLLLLLICLMLGGIFSLMVLLIAKQAGWLARLPFPRKKAAAPAEAAASAANPTKPAAGQGK